MNVRDIPVERACAADYDELMDFLCRCFRTVNPAHVRFETLMPDVYQPEESLMQCHCLLRVEGRIVAAAGIYPLQIRMGEIGLKMAGIGGVSALPSLRGAGCMTKLVTHIGKVLAEEGYALSWLSGDRVRYNRFGWETAGSTFAVTLSSKMADSDSGAGFSCRRWDGNARDWHAFLRARSDRVVRGECDEVALRRKLNRYQHELWVARNNHSFAYISLCRAWRLVAEWGGAPAGVAALLRQLLNKDVKPWCVHVPPVQDECNDLFFAHAEKIGTANDNLAIISLFELLGLYEPCWLPRWPRQQVLRLRMTSARRPTQEVLLTDTGVTAGTRKDVSAMIELDELRMVRMLFGPVRPTQYLYGLETWMDQVFPLPFYLPVLWSV